jgi:SAM-dependent methyltransferase
VQTVRAFLRTRESDRWLRRNAHRTAFEELYASRPDPWALAISPLAHQRYLQLIETLSAYTPCATILDVGCGEGHFTRYLGGMADRVVGIDVSASALQRAAHRLPAGEFVCAGIEEYTPVEVFDVVTAIEVLYYARPVDRALDRLLTFGRRVVVSYSNGHRHEVAEVVEAHPRLASLERYSFLGTKRFGFTVAQFCGDRGSISSEQTLRPHSIA